MINTNVDRVLVATRKKALDYFNFFSLVFVSQSVMMSCDDVSNSRGKVPATYLLVILKTGTTFAAHFPDVPGCIATSTDLMKLKMLANDALVMHLEGILEDGDSLPVSTTFQFDKRTLKGDGVFVEEGWVNAFLGS